MPEYDAFGNPVPGRDGTPGRPADLPSLEAPARRPAVGARPARGGWSRPITALAIMVVVAGLVILIAESRSRPADSPSIPTPDWVTATTPAPPAQTP